MTEAEDFPILIVDDDPAALVLLRRHLTDAGRTVFQANNGEEALRMILTEAPRIVITDWSMPGMTGLELCQAIRSHELVGFIYIIVLTSHGETDRIVAAFEAGADDYLTKSFSARELIARLRAGERIARLQGALEKRTREVHRVNAEMALFADKLEEANEKLLRLATTDELTTLVNRREAMKRLTEQWRIVDRTGAPLSCIALDIDHFKKFNDTWGHAFGDTVLKEMARVLRTSLRAGSVPCRMGGEEFLVLCPETTEPEATKAAERLRAAVEHNQIPLNDQKVQVTVSLGVAGRTAQMQAPDDMLKAADDALYAAKRSGRNRVCVADPNATGNAEGSRPTQAAAIVQEPNAQPAPDRRQAAGDEHLRAVLVDSDLQRRHLCRAALERAEYLVTEADGLEAALNVIDRSPPDLVVTAYRAPGVSGVSLISRMKASAATHDVPVLVLGSGGSPVEMLTALQTGAEQYLPAPVDLDELSRRAGPPAPQPQDSRAPQRGARRAHAAGDARGGLLPGALQCGEPGSHPGRDAGGRGRADVQPPVVHPAA